MSRIGRSPIAVPSGVTVTIDGATVTVKGPKGELSVKLVAEVTASVDDKGIHVTPRKEMEKAPQMWGMSRTLVNNLVAGVTTGFTQKLEIQGVGYRAAVQGKNLQLQLGYSHDVVYPIPEGITIAAAKPTEIKITGSDKQKVGQAAADVRAWRKPEPYKGKGIRYRGEYVRRKVGKAGTK